MASAEVFVGAGGGQAQKRSPTRRKKWQKDPHMVKNVEKWPPHGEKSSKRPPNGRKCPHKEKNVAKRPPHGEKVTNSPSYSRKKNIYFSGGASTYSCILLSCIIYF